MSVEFRRIHIVGAGGAGMSALAKVLVQMGHEVTGSDLRGGAGLDALADLGVPVFAGHHPEVATTAELVVASSAVPDYDEELEAARRAGIPVWRRPELLGALTEDSPALGATGTHGKTTTTALIITALRALDLDPSFILGGELVALGANGHLGESDLLVVEADEAFRTFESIHFAGLVITNVEPEHLEHFGAYQDQLDSFIQVARRVEGPVLVCVDDPGAAQVAAATDAITYGRTAGADWRIEDVRSSGSGVGFVLTGPRGVVHVELPLPGEHVALNAAGALALVAEAGYDLAKAASGLSRFRGVGRRWEYRGTVGGVVIYDDYAHHPTEVAATLRAARQVVTGRLWAVFQPHLYSRTERFSGEFGEALALADVVVVTDVYGAREAPVPGVSGRLVADAAAEHHAEVHYVAHRAQLADYLAPRVAAGDLVVTMGAGDITLLPAELAKKLAERS